MKDRTVNILLVEDDEVDAEAVRRGFSRARVANPVRRVPDGIEALRVLRGEGTEPMPAPYLILLDLGLPRMNGVEFLEELRRDEKLRNSVVFVLTTSDEDRDKAAAYARNVAGYVVKTRAGDDFVRLIAALEYYWRVVEFPPASA